MSLTSEQVKVIKATVPVLQEYGNAITVRFYKDMLKDAPYLNNFFNQTNQINGHQADALAKSLCAYAIHIDDLGVLSPAVERICQKHASLYIRPGQYDTIGIYLLQAMKDVLGDALTKDIHNAWAVAYRQLANLMINREVQLLEGAGDWSDWRDFRISAKVQESSLITSFILTPLDAQPLPEYLPGQYISIRVPVPDVHYLQSRQYSLSDAPQPDHYRISVKKELVLDLAHPDVEAHQGYISNILHDKKNVGDILQASHPAGEFFCDINRTETSEHPIVLISAGVGLTPNLSILNTLTAKGSKSKISWVHAARNSQVQAFGNHIKQLVTDHDNVRSHVFIKEILEGDREGVDYQFKGRMSLHKLDGDQDLFLRDPSTEYYICGPENFMVDMRNVLRDMGVGSERIKLEVFGSGDISSV